MVPEIRGYATRQIVLAANETFQLVGEGSTFYVISATGAISVKPSGGGGVKLAAKNGIRCPQGSMFQNMSVTNETGAPNTVLVFFGFGDFIDNT